MIYDRVKEICESKGLTISALEKQAGLGNGTIGGWRNSIPSISTLSKVATALGITVDQLIDGIQFTMSEK